MVLLDDFVLFFWHGAPTSDRDVLGEATTWCYLVTRFYSSRFLFKPVRGYLIFDYGWRYCSVLKVVKGFEGHVDMTATSLSSLQGG